jgi:TonB family protein
MITWLTQALVSAALAAAAAYCLESALRNSGLPTRHAWSSGLVLSLGLPFLPRFITTSQPTIAIPLMDFTAIDATVVRIDGGGPADPRWWWLAISAAAAVITVVSYLRLRWQRAEWQSGSVQGQDVLVSERYGPAVVGFINPAIVVPAWVLNATGDRQRLIITHESAHIRARDHWLLLLSLLAVVLMPWNPFVWLMAARLRFAIETDCDQRVLAAAPDRQGYARLLVDVGGHRSGSALTAALAEHRNGLERRVVMIMSQVIRRPGRAAIFAAAATLLVIAACESRVPTDAPAKSSEGTAGSITANPEREQGQQHDTAPSAAASQEPAFTPYTKKPELANREEIVRALVENYPPLLRDAGIGGQVMVWTLIDTNGDVVATRIKTSSGHAALDEAATVVAKRLKFSPALNGTTPVKVWIQLPIVFKTQ